MYSEGSFGTSGRTLSKATSIGLALFEAGLGRFGVMHKMIMVEVVPTAKGPSFEPALLDLAKRLRDVLQIIVRAVISMYLPFALQCWLRAPRAALTECDMCNIRGCFTVTRAPHISGHGVDGADRRNIKHLRKRRSVEGGVGHDPIGLARSLRYLQKERGPHS